MDEKIQEQALKRLTIIQGHLKKVVEMVQEGSYCPHVIHQSQAVQSALKKVDEIVFQGHLHGCVVKNIKAGEEERVLGELMELFKKT